MAKPSRSDNRRHFLSQLSPGPARLVAPSEGRHASPGFPKSRLRTRTVNSAYGCRLPTTFQTELHCCSGRPEAAWCKRLHRRITTAHPCDERGEGRLGQRTHAREGVSAPPSAYTTRPVHNRH